jgi:hypothetical protein
VSISNTAHSGSHSAQVGSTSPRNGSSTLYQTITIPSAGKTTLSFWYFLSSTDTIQYDWQRAYVTDTSGRTLMTIFNECTTTSGWVQSTTDLSSLAGRAVRIAFLDHDDGYPGDPTYMLVDDVSVTHQ